MTGEITLRGRVLGVGGIKEKAVAAYQGTIKRIILPASSSGELERLPAEVLNGVEFLQVHTMDEVLDAALASSPRTRSPADLVGGAQDTGIQLSQ
jgi:ATP-dependent Lon protease